MSSRLVHFTDVPAGTVMVDGEKLKLSILTSTSEAGAAAAPAVMGVCGVAPALLFAFARKSKSSASADVPKIHDVRFMFVVPFEFVADFYPSVESMTASACLPLM